MKKLLMAVFAIIVVGCSYGNSDSIDSIARDSFETGVLIGYKVILDEYNKTGTIPEPLTLLKISKQQHNALCVGLGYDIYFPEAQGE